MANDLRKTRGESRTGACLEQQLQNIRFLSWKVTPLGQLVITVAEQPLLAKEILIKPLTIFGVLLIILAVGVVYFGLSSCSTFTIECPSSIVGLSVFAMLAIGLSLIAIGIGEGRLHLSSANSQAMVAAINRSSRN